MNVVKSNSSESPLFRLGSAAGGATSGRKKSVPSKKEFASKRGTPSKQAAESGRSGRDQTRYKSLAPESLAQEEPEMAPAAVPLGGEDAKQQVAQLHLA